MTEACARAVRAGLFGPPFRTALAARQEPPFFVDERGVQFASQSLGVEFLLQIEEVNIPLRQGQPLDVSVSEVLRGRDKVYLLGYLHVARPVDSD